MFKVCATWFVVALAATTINALVIHTPVNQAYNIWSPYSTVNQDGIQNAYANGAYNPFGYGYGYGQGYGYPGNFQVPNHLPMSAYDNVRINIPFTHQMNLMSEGAQINSNNMQNLETYD